MNTSIPFASRHFTSTRRFTAVLGIFSACLLTLVTTVRAQTLYYWTGNAGGGNWTTAGNWNTATQGGAVASNPPGTVATDTATINQGTTAGSPLTLSNGATTTIGLLTLSSLASSTSYLTISGSSTLLYSNTGVAGYNIGQGSGSTSAISLASGGSLTLNGTTGQVVLASAANSTVSLTVGSGSTFTTTTTGIVRLANNTNANATLTVNSGGTASIAAQLNVGNGASSAGSLILNGGSLTSNATNIGVGGTGSLTISAGSSMTAGQTTIGSTSTGNLAMSGGTVGVSLLTVGTGTNGNGTATITGGTVTSTAGATVAGSGATAGALRVKGSGQVLLNSGNTGSIILTVGQNATSGSAGTLLLEGGTIAAAAGATNGFGVSLYTPGTLTSTTTTSSIQGYGTLSVGGTGAKIFTNGGKVIASGANLVSGVGSASDQTLALNGSTFTVAATANRAAGSGWYAVNHGQLAMNMSGTTSGTTLNWGAPTGSFSGSSLINSAQLTLNASTAPSAVTISLFATDRTDMASVLARTGLPGGTIIGLWNIANGSANTWTGLTLRYDDVLAASQTPSLYYTPTASGSWSLINTTVDLGNFLVSDSVASLNNGYYALSVVPEPVTVSLFFAGGMGLLIFSRIRRRTV